MGQNSYQVMDHYDIDKEIYIGELDFEKIEIQKRAVFLISLRKMTKGYNVCENMANAHFRLYTSFPITHI